MPSEYQKFLDAKSPAKKLAGFRPIWLPNFLFPFQREIVSWAIELGRCAIFEECGLGKSPQELVWAENVVRKTNKPVLLLTPIAVAPQMIREGEKFGIKATRSREGEVHKGITVTNIHRIHYYNPKDFAGVVVDESSCLKSFSSKYRKLVTEFLGKVEYRLLATATPAPNDFMELGTSSEALGIMGRNQMLGMFFTNDGETTQRWRLRGHARKRFWQWMGTWSRAIRKPSDLGYDDGKFALPPLHVVSHKVDSKATVGFFPKMAGTLSEQRKEKRSSLQNRCELAANIVPKDRPCVLWCQLNDEGDLLEKLIPDAVQVAGSDSDDVKEKRLNDFSLDKIRVLVSKPSIAGLGLNWQHCSDVVYFPSWSHESYYQAIRRCWRFGQEKEVTCNLIFSEAEGKVVSGMLQKEKQSVTLYDGIIQNMVGALKVKESNNGKATKIEVPKWL